MSQASKNRKQCATKVQTAEKEERGEENSSPGFVNSRVLLLVKWLVLKFYFFFAVLLSTFNIPLTNKVKHQYVSHKKIFMPVSMTTELFILNGP